MTIKNKSKFDLSWVSLLVINLVVMVIALIQGWNLTIIATVYLGQSFIIGAFNFFKILNLKNFDTKGLKINGKDAAQIVMDRGFNFLRIYVAFFFLFHYGLFHITYLVFLSGQLDYNVQDSFFVAFSLFLFFINHLVSYVYNKKNDESNMVKKNIGHLMFYPYARILPMHLGIVFGLFLSSGVMGLFFFLCLKIIADLIMHTIEHKGKI